MSFQKCPICQGRGKVEFGFYHIGTTYQNTVTVSNDNAESCRTCHGRGVIKESDFDMTNQLKSNEWGLYNEYEYIG